MEVVGGFVSLGGDSWIIHIAKSTAFICCRIEGPDLLHIMCELFSGIPSDGNFCLDLPESRGFLSIHPPGDLQPTLLLPMAVKDGREARYKLVRGTVHTSESCTCSSSCSARLGRHSLPAGYRSLSANRLQCWLYVRAGPRLARHPLTNIRPGLCRHEERLADL